SSTRSGTGLPSAAATTTRASAARYASGDTPVLPSQTVLGTRPVLRSESSTSAVVRVNWLASVSTLSPIAGERPVGPNGARHRRLRRRELPALPRRVGPLAEVHPVPELLVDELARVVINADQPAPLGQELLARLDEPVLGLAQVGLAAEVGPQGVRQVVER